MKFSLILSIILLTQTTQINSQTQVVLLGTGTPNPDIERFGPSTAVVVNGVPYVVDCGPGVVRRCAAAEKNGVKDLGATEEKLLQEIKSKYSSKVVSGHDLDVFE